MTARWEVCVRAGGLVALALRRSEVVVLDTRGVSSAVQVGQMQNVTRGTWGWACLPCVVLVAARFECRCRGEGE